MNRDEDVTWPALDPAGWDPTWQTLHRYLQVVGKVKLSLVPPLPHWAHTTLDLGDRGLTTGTMPYDGRAVEISFDLLDHRLVVATDDRGALTLDLGARPACADFHRDLFDALDALGVQVDIRPVPYDLEGPAFPEDTVHRTYEAEAVTAYWKVLASTDRVLRDLPSGFAGAAGPVQLFWHRFDLSHTRQVGNRVVAFGFGDVRDRPGPAFHVDVTPEPDRLAEEPLSPGLARGRRSGPGHRAVLPYGVVQAAPDPHRTLLDFYRSAALAVTRRAGPHADRPDLR